jgi:hypothetical protein
MGRRYNGTIVQRYNGATMRRYNGTTVRQYDGTKVQKAHVQSKHTLVPSYRRTVTPIIKKSPSQDSIYIMFRFQLNGLSPNGL